MSHYNMDVEAAVEQFCDAQGLSRLSELDLLRRQEKLLRARILIREAFEGCAEQPSFTEHPACSTIVIPNYLPKYF